MNNQNYFSITYSRVLMVCYSFVLVSAAICLFYAAISLLAKMALLFFLCVYGFYLVRKIRFPDFNMVFDKDTFYFLDQSNGFKQKIILSRSTIVTRYFIYFRYREKDFYFPRTILLVRDSLGKKQFREFIICLRNSSAASFF